MKPIIFTEEDKLINNTQVVILLNGDLMTFQLNENMQMVPAIEPDCIENLFLMKALIEDVLSQFNVLN